jgi:hypothetical protein
MLIYGPGSVVLIEIKADYIGKAAGNLCFIIKLKIKAVYIGKAARNPLLHH